MSNENIAGNIIFADHAREFVYNDGKSLILVISSFDDGDFVDRFRKALHEGGITYVTPTYQDNMIDVVYTSFDMIARDWFQNMMLFKEQNGGEVSDG